MKEENEVREACHRCKELSVLDKGLCPTCRERELNSPKQNLLCKKCETIGPVVKESGLCPKCDAAAMKKRLFPDGIPGEEPKEPADWKSADPERRAKPKEEKAPVSSKPLSAGRIRKTTGVKSSKAKRQRKKAECLECHREMIIVARGLCGRCADRLRKKGTFKMKYPKLKTGKKKGAPKSDKKRLNTKKKPDQKGLNKTNRKPYTEKEREDIDKIINAEPLSTVDKMKKFMIEAEKLALHFEFIAESMKSKIRMIEALNEQMEILKDIINKVSL